MLLILIHGSPQPRITTTTAGKKKKKSATLHRKAHNEVRTETESSAAWSPRKKENSSVCNLSAEWNGNLRLFHAALCIKHKTSKSLCFS